MNTTTLIKKTSLEQKINIIFDYILKHKENMFWNTLNDTEQKEVKQRGKGKFEDFDKVRKEIVGK